MAPCKAMQKLVAVAWLVMQPCEGAAGVCTGDPCSDSQLCRSKFGFCGATSDHCNSDSIWTADCISTTTTATAPTAREIHSGDAIFLKVRGGSGNHVDVEGEAVQARWQDRGAWQMLFIERMEGPGVIHVGDAVSLRAHTGKRIDVQGDKVLARWNDEGLWQTFLIEKSGEGPIPLPIRENDAICLKAHTGKYIDFEGSLAQARFGDCGNWQALRVEAANSRAVQSGDMVHLKAHTGAYIDVQGTSVNARWNEKGDWQTLILEHPQGQTVFHGDTIFLKAHTGNHIDVTSDLVQARFHDQGGWQAFRIEKNGEGAVFPGDTIYLQAHTGKHIEVEGDVVCARWQDRGTWQSLMLEQKNQPSTTIAVAQTTVTTTSGFLAPTTTTTTARPDITDRCSAENRGCPDPDGKGISAWFTKAVFNEMFPQICNPACSGCSLLSYNCLIQATLLYPQFAASGSETENRRELAAWLGIMAQETTGGGCLLSQENSDGTCSCGPMWCDNHPGGGCEAWGLCKFVEATGDPYCDANSIHYPCVAGKTYSGRGPKQLSWNANYGQFSEEFCGDKDILLNHPERIATNPTLAWASSIWFWFSGGACVPEAGEICKPGCHAVFLGLNTKCPADVSAGREYGLGWATNVVNGGLECGSAGRGKCDFRVHSRVKYYKRFCSILGIDPLAAGWTDVNLFCSHQKNYVESPPSAC